MAQGLILHVVLRSSGSVLVNAASTVDTRPKAPVLLSAMPARMILHVFGRLYILLWKWIRRPGGWSSSLWLTNPPGGDVEIVTFGGFVQWQPGELPPWHRAFTPPDPMDDFY